MRAARDGLRTPRSRPPSSREAEGWVRPQRRAGRPGKSGSHHVAADIAMNRIGRVDRSKGCLTSKLNPTEKQKSHAGPRGASRKQPHRRATTGSARAWLGLDGTLGSMCGRLWSD
eukprot:scaffold25077_cov116-Isochrysis_galbana.AAC.2